MTVVCPAVERSMVLVPLPLPPGPPGPPFPASSPPTSPSGPGPPFPPAKLLRNCCAYSTFGDTLLKSSAVNGRTSPRLTIDETSLFKPPQSHFFLFQKRYHEHTAATTLEAAELLFASQCCKPASVPGSSYRHPLRRCTSLQQRDGSPSDESVSGAFAKDIVWPPSRAPAGRAKRTDAPRHRVESTGAGLSYSYLVGRRSCDALIARLETSRMSFRFRAPA